MRREWITKAVVKLEVLTIHDLPATTYKTRLLATLSPLLVPDYWAVNSLVSVLPLIRADSQQEVVERCREFALKLRSGTTALTL